MKKTFLACAIVLACAFTFGSHADALKLTPTIKEYSARPGDALSGVLQLVNDSALPASFNIETMDAQASTGEGGFAEYSPRNETSTLSNWITLRESNIAIAPGETKNIQYIIAIPQDAPPGGHYAAIKVASGAANVPGGASLSSALAANIALDVEGQALEKGDVVSFATVDGKTNYDKLPVSFITRINNGGNRHFKPKGSIEVKNMFGSVVASLPLNQTNGGGNVLPRSTREFKNEWLGEFAFGKYTALLTTQLGGAGTKTASLELWVMPAGLLILWLVIALIIIVILILLIKRALQSSAIVKK